jgi:hypothetical protein
MGRKKGNVTGYNLFCSWWNTNSLAVERAEKKGAEDLGSLHGK